MMPQVKADFFLSKGFAIKIMEKIIFMEMWKKGKIHKKSRQPFDPVAVHLDAHRAAAVPAVFPHIEMRFRVGGTGISEKQVARAVSLSADKYCSVSRMLQPGVEITHSYEILDNGTESA